MFSSLSRVTGVWHRASLKGLAGGLDGTLFGVEEDIRTAERVEQRKRGHEIEEIAKRDARWWRVNSCDFDESAGERKSQAKLDRCMGKEFVVTSVRGLYHFFPGPLYCDVA